MNAHRQCVHNLLEVLVAHNPSPYCFDCVSGPVDSHNTDVSLLVLMSGRSRSAEA